MTTVEIEASTSIDAGDHRGVRARPSPFLRDVASVAGRALRAVPRERETVIPPIFIALFFFVVNIGTLQQLTESNIKGFDIKAFMMPTAILIGVTGVSRAGSLVLDIQGGYFDRGGRDAVRRVWGECSPRRWPNRLSRLRLSRFWGRWTARLASPSARRAPSALWWASPS